MSRVIVIAGVLALSLSLVLAGAAMAKGGPSPLTGVSVSGGELAGARSVQVRLPDNVGDGLLWVEVPSWNGYIDLDARAPRQPAPGEVPYRIVLHYEFAEPAGLRMDRVGAWDGASRLYFPGPTITGAPGFCGNCATGWPAGWFEATPALTKELLWALAPPDLARWHHPGGFSTKWYQVLPLLTLGGLWFVGRGAWGGAQASATLVEVEERLASRRLPDPF